MRLNIIAAVQYDKRRWQIGQPIPKIEKLPNGMWHQVGGHEGTRIEKLQLVGDSVEIWWRKSDDAANGYHTTLCKPTVSSILSMAKKEEWQASMDELDKRESVETVTDLSEKVWQLNHDLPEDARFTIVRMAMLGESVEVFAMPKPNTPFDQAGLFFHVQLMPFFVDEIQAKSSLSDWVQLQTDFALMADELENDGEDDDEEEEEEEPLQTAPALAPPPPPPPQAMNGIPQSIQPIQETQE